MFDLTTLRGQGLAASAASIFIFIAIAVTGMFAVYQLSSSISDVDSRVTLSKEHIMPLAEAAESIKFDVVQVQQWLTDISATRGLDGLNDGMDVAAEFAKKFDADVEIAMGHANDLNLTDVVNRLNATKAAFPEYYSVGQKMAQSYIEFGPAGGNKMMATFDGAAEKINTEVDGMVEVIISFEEKSTEAMAAASLAAKEQATLQLYILLGLFIVGCILLFVITKKTDKVMVIVENVSSSLGQARVGNLSHRIIGIHGTGADAKIQHNFNHLMDISEAYVREIRASMEFVSNGQYFRTILEEGMRGSFLASVKTVNDAVGQMAKKVDDFTAVSDTFEVNMKGVVETVTSAATELQATAQSMESTATVTSEKANVVATAADDASANVQTVASAAEELSASISEISRQVGQSSEIASQAVVDADQSRENVQGLAESAAKIGEVINLISDIADQTNLLALNATIEAARAGDAGKGFAVVASEVKNLANQTAKATEEISQQVGGVQHATEDAVKAIQGIGATIGKIDEASTAIASAVEEQGAATQEIARNVEQAATGTNEVTANITEVTQGASETGHAAKEVLTAADELARQGDLLGREMDSFLVELRKVI